MDSIFTCINSKSQDAYRVPVPGEMVTVSGMRSRPELNGAAAEIVNSGVDQFGRVTVRVYDGMGHSLRTSHFVYH